MIGLCEGHRLEDECIKSVFQSVMPFLLFVQSIAAIGKVPNRVVDN
jgi:hypothetical protein